MIGIGFPDEALFINLDAVRKMKEKEMNEAICVVCGKLRNVIAVEVDTGFGMKYSIKSACANCRSVLSTYINSAISEIRDEDKSKEK